jgi:hypothetical protein
MMSGSGAKKRNNHIISFRFQISDFRPEAFHTDA